MDSSLCEPFRTFDISVKLSRIYVAPKLKGPR